MEPSHPGEGSLVVQRLPDADTRPNARQQHQAALFCKAGQGGLHHTPCEVVQRQPDGSTGAKHTLGYCLAVFTWEGGLRLSSEGIQSPREERGSLPARVKAVKCMEPDRFGALGYYHLVHLLGVEGEWAISFSQKKEVARPPSPCQQRQREPQKGVPAARMPQIWRSMPDLWVWEMSTGFPIWINGS